MAARQTDDIAIHEKFWKEHKINHGEFAAHFFKRLEEMTEVDSEAAEVYERGYHLFGKPERPTARWEFTGKPFVFKSSVRSKHSYWFMVRFNWKKPIAERYDYAFVSRNAEELSQLLGPGRHLMRAIFERETGLKLPDSTDELLSFLNQWVAEAE